MSNFNSFNEQRERDEQRGDEWQYGAIAKDLAAVPYESRTQYLPVGVLQYNNVMDTNGCASRAYLNILETKLDYFYDNGMHPAIKKWLDDNGYRKDGKFALCDAFIEILSKTTRQGNSLKAPIDTISNYGVIPAYLIPLEDNMTWDEYMNPDRVTKKCIDLGKEFLRRLSINYEQVPLSQFDEAVKADSLAVALHAWSVPVANIYPATDEPFNHAIERYSNEIGVFDNYYPFMKTLARDYKFFDWGYSVSITFQNPYPDESILLFEVFRKYGLLRFLLEALRRLNMPPEAPKTPPTDELPSKPIPDPPMPETPQNKATLENLCLAIRDFEGKPGDANYRNNNPGNCRYNEGGYLPIYGPVRRSPNGFAIFPTYEQGWLYLQNFLKSILKKYPNLTLEEFIGGKGRWGGYSPASDGNPVNEYATFLANRLGVDTSYKIGGITYT